MGKKKRPDAFVLPDGTRPIAPTKGERQDFIGKGFSRKPLLSAQDAKRIRAASRSTRKGGTG